MRLLESKRSGGYSDYISLTQYCRGECLQEKDDFTQFLIRAGPRVHSDGYARGSRGGLGGQPLTRDKT